MSRKSSTDGPWIDPAEAGCRLLAKVGPHDALEPHFAVTGLAGLLIEVGEPAVAAEQVRAAHAAGRAALLVDRPELVRGLGADGVHLNRPGELDDARARLDQDELIGAACGRSRHDAMVAGEAGADYVLFGTPEAPPPDGIDALAEHVAWWAEIAVLPCVAAGRFDAGEVRRLVLAGTDFILPAIDGDAVLLATLASVLEVQKR